MNNSLCYSCDHAIAIKYISKQGKEFNRLKCCKLMEYVEKYSMEYCSHHSNVPSVEQIRSKVQAKYNEEPKIKPRYSKEGTEIK